MEFSVSFVKQRSSEKHWGNGPYQLQHCIHLPMGAMGINIRYLKLFLAHNVTSQLF